MYLLNEWSPLPAWARFLVLLGHEIARSSIQRGLIAVASVPTRVYAAAFCGLGVVLSRACAAAPTDPCTHFESLRSLPIGTAVIYRPSPTRKLKGRFGGFRETNGTEYAVVEDGNKLDHLVAAAYSLRIEPAAGTLIERPRHSRLRWSSDSHGLYAKLLGVKAGDLLDYSRLDCVILGTVSKIHDEINEKWLGIYGKHPTIARGCLQDLLRVRRFLSDGHYRSDVIAGRGPRAGHLAVPDTAVAVLDGAAVFLRWPPSHPVARAIAVLDRTEPRFEESISEANRRFMASRSRDVGLAGLGPVPPGLDLMILQNDTGTQLP